MTRGIDVSQYQGAINWVKVKESGITTVIVRCGWGQNNIDKRAAENIQGAINAGLSVGAYWFIYARSIPEAQKNGGKAAGFGAMPGDDNTLRFGWHLVLEQGLTSFVPLLPIGACVMLDSTLDPTAAMGGAWTEISWGNAPAGVKLWKRTQ